MIPLLIALSVGPARAKTAFPTLVEEAAGMPCTPSCGLCHEGVPGVGTATSEFALAAKERGLVPGDDASVAAALDALEADGVDSDGDGTGDVEELAAGADPNGGPAFCEGPTPEWGCVAHVRGIPGRALLLAGLSLVVSTWRRKR